MSRSHQAALLLRWCKETLQRVFRAIEQPPQSTVIFLWQTLIFEKLAAMHGDPTLTLDEKAMDLIVIR
jgi:hypothetical protein